jgi:phenylacetic acid degradation operon negative regulatory protein
MQSPLYHVLKHLQREPSRTGSIVVTIYGDAIAPRGGSLWLGTLCELFAAMQISDGVVRTAASRLAADGWLARHRVGRNSYYRLGPKGTATFAQAASRIYGRHAPPREQKFKLVVLNQGRDRDTTRATLQQAGFGTAAPGLLVAPAHAPLPPGVADAIVLQAEADSPTTRRLARQAWPLEALAAQYNRFLTVFTPLQAAMQSGITDLDSLLLRILLVHEYRRIILRDPLLPTPMLPEDWPGDEARALCAILYPLLLPASERWLDGHALNQAGPLPAADGSIQERFLD